MTDLDLVNESFVSINATALKVGDTITNLGEVTQIVESGVFLVVRYKSDFWDDEINQLGVIGDIEWTGREREVFYHCQDENVVVERKLLPVGTTVRAAQADVGGRWNDHELGTLLPNDYPTKYAYMVKFADYDETPPDGLTEALEGTGLAFLANIERVFYFFDGEVVAA